MIEFDSVSKQYEINHRRAKSLRDVFSFNKKPDANPEIFKAVDDVSFSIDSGKSVGVLGRNGAGKSTLLKLLTRIISPTSGKITVDGSISCLLEVGAGFHHELSGYENIFLCGSILGMSRKQVKSKIESIIDFSEVEKFIDEPVKYYSSGMYMRLAFAIGAHLDSDILVIDEALAVGDSRFQNKCLNKIDEIRKSGKTIFFVSHSIEQVKKVCDTSIVMDHGKLLFQGNTDEAERIYNSFTNGA